MRREFLDWRYERPPHCSGNSFITAVNVTLLLGPYKLGVNNDIRTYVHAAGTIGTIDASSGQAMRVRGNLSEPWLRVARLPS